MKKLEYELRSVLAIAYHEAGRAVVAMELGRSTADITIEPVGITLGRVDFYKPGNPLRAGMKLTRSQRARCNREMHITLAGPLAETHVTGC